MRGLVISAGGNRGAAGVGKLSRIGGEYDFGAGASTGAIMIVPAILGEYSLLKEYYTGVCPDDVFDVNPVNKRGRFKLWRIIWRLVTGRRTITTSLALRDSIEKMYKQGNLWNKLILSGKTAYVAVYNATTMEIDYISSDTCSLYDWLDYVWASACHPPIMSIMVKKGCEYTDGGLSELLPMEFAANRIADHLTVISLRPEKKVKIYKSRIRNLIHFAIRLIIGMRKEIAKNDLKAGRKACALNMVDYDIHHVTQGFGENSLIFDPKKMTEWYNSANTEPLNPELGRF